MSEKICTSGHVMNDGDVTCPRCGAGSNLTNNLNTNMNEQENEVVVNEEVSGAEARHAGVESEVEVEVAPEQTEEVADRGAVEDPSVEPAEVADESVRVEDPQAAE